MGEAKVKQLPAIAACIWFGDKSWLLSTSCFYVIKGTMIMKMSTQTQIRIRITLLKAELMETNVLTLFF